MYNKSEKSTVFKGLEKEHRILPVLEKKGVGLA